MSESVERREAKRLARAKNFYLWRLVLDGWERRPREGRFEISGPLPPMCAAELRALIQRWEEEGLV